jgi:hypothetical protein
MNPPVSIDEVSMVPKLGDLLIRTTPTLGELQQFVLLDAVSERVIAGPSSFNELVRTAQRLRSSEGQIWQQFADDRGRPIGPALLLEYHRP